MFSKYFLPKSCDEFEIIDGRDLKLTVRFENVTMELINVYAPVKTTERMFLKTCENLKQCDMENILILAGDFNRT